MAQEVKVVEFERSCVCMRASLYMWMRELWTLDSTASRTLPLMLLPGELWTELKCKHLWWNTHFYTHRTFTEMLLTELWRSTHIQERQIEQLLRCPTTCVYATLLATAFAITIVCMWHGQTSLDRKKNKTNETLYASVERRSVFTIHRCCALHKMLRKHVERTRTHRPRHFAFIIR